MEATKTRTNKMLIGQAMAIVGSIGFPSKMPGMSYGLEAGTTCPRSKRLVAEHGDKAVCAHCYAKKGQYPAPSVVKGHAKRLRGLEHPQWVEAMTTLINHYRYNGKKGVDTRFFRWHDSGDIMDLQHLRKIVAVVEGCPDVKFWLPTHEPKTVGLYLMLYGSFPENLTVRVSADLIGDDAETVGDLPTSTVGSGRGWVCRANQNDNECGACRVCWNSKADNVDYPLH